MKTWLIYSENNSRGRKWLDDNAPKALEDGGWTVWIRTFDLVQAVIEIPGPLGAQDGIDDWASLTGADPMALGCYSCCGPPHHFTVAQKATMPENAYDYDKVIDYYSPQPSGSTY